VPTGEEILDAVLYLGRFMLGEIGLMADAPNAQAEKLMTAKSEKSDKVADDATVESLEL
jgi:extracellular matrix protein 14